jgi:hypothetical protein
MAKNVADQFVETLAAAGGRGDDLVDLAKTNLWD